MQFRSHRRYNDAKEVLRRFSIFNETHYRAQEENRRAGNETHYTVFGMFADWSLEELDRVGFDIASIGYSTRLRPFSASETGRAPYHPDFNHQRC